VLCNKISFDYCELNNNNNNDNNIDIVSVELVNNILSYNIITTHNNSLLTNIEYLSISDWRYKQLTYNKLIPICLNHICETQLNNGPPYQLYSLIQLNGMQITWNTTDIQLYSLLHQIKLSFLNYKQEIILQLCNDNI
jgi:hypothetical protein